MAIVDETSSVVDSNLSLVEITPDDIEASKSADDKSAKLQSADAATEKCANQISTDVCDNKNNQGLNKGRNYCNDCTDFFLDLNCIF